MKKRHGLERSSMSILKKIITGTLALIFLFIQLFIYYVLLFGVYYQKDLFSEALFEILYLVIFIIGLCIVASIYNKNVNQSYKLTWTIMILSLPYFGVFCYLLYGNGKTMPKRKNKKIRQYLIDKIPENDDQEILKESDKVGYNLINGLNYTTHFPCYDNCKTTFFNDAFKKNEDMKKELLSAKKYIFLEFFILSDGILLDEIISILEEKGKQGIKIYFIHDDFGSKRFLKRKTISRIQNIPNLLFLAYAPFGKNLNPAINYRDHRKIVVVDGRVAFCGGDNLADEYVHLKNRFGFWRDNALKIEGEAVISFVLLFLEMWYMSSKIMLNEKNFYPDKIEKFESTGLIMPFGDGPTYNRHPAYSLFLSMISSAKTRILISTPYFVIDKDFISCIVRAIQNGVEVSILIPEIPDKKSVFFMTQGHLGEILKAGGKVYLFAGGFTHAKNIIIDSDYAYIGTSNIDYRSLYLHFECGTFLIHDSSIKDMINDYEDAIKKSKLFTYNDWKNRPLTNKIAEFLLSFYSPLL